MSKLPKPNKKSIIFEDDNVYACLAKYPITKGHTVVVSKKEFDDLSKMPDIYYDFLMDMVFAVRNSLIKTLKVKKVYLVYMDETNFVHWHLIPRYKEKGFNVFQQKTEFLKNFPLAEKIKKNLFFK
ncbi:MAG: Hit-like protein involved in cell-cycle regulation [Parcubacteria group bacterium Licking1014_17]|nr:MAG: Hit-like protein involved in cell-cycle regulation [Parcubacteria group bacterium Licking1014_17]